MQNISTERDIQSLEFEEAQKELEIIVQKLESGEIKLKDSIALYERGVLLRQHCNALLDNARLRISQITDTNNSVSEVNISNFSTIPGE